VILEEMMTNMPRFTMMAIGLIAVLLFAVFRRTVGVLLPLLTVILSLLGTFGAMSAFGEPITIVSQILPSFLRAVSVGYAVHLLAIFSSISTATATSTRPSSMRWGIPDWQSSSPV